MKELIIEFGKLEALITKALPPESAEERDKQIRKVRNLLFQFSSKWETMKQLVTKPEEK